MSWGRTTDLNDACTILLASGQCVYTGGNWYFFSLWIQLGFKNRQTQYLLSDVRYFHLNDWGGLLGLAETTHPSHWQANAARGVLTSRVCECLERFPTASRLFVPPLVDLPSSAHGIIIILWVSTRERIM